MKDKMRLHLRTITKCKWKTVKISRLRVLVQQGGGQVVSVLAFYSDDPISNPAEAYSFSVKFVLQKNENKQKEAGVGPCF